MSNSVYYRGHLDWLAGLPRRSRDKIIHASNGLDTVGRCKLSEQLPFAPILRGMIVSSGVTEVFSPVWTRLFREL
jgi:hypothetical protein